MVDLADAEIAAMGVRHGELKGGKELLVDVVEDARQYSAPCRRGLWRLMLEFNHNAASKGALAIVVPKAGFWRFAARGKISITMTECADHLMFEFLDSTRAHD